MIMTTEINPETHHPRTGAKRTTTLEQAAPRSTPSVAQVLAVQKADQAVNKAGNVAKAEQLPTPIELTEAQRAENLARNMATVGS
jgi:hypothetical protein